MKRLKIITSPVVEPISLEMAKLQCRGIVAEDEPLIQAYIKAARCKGESLTRKQFVEAEYEMTLEAWATMEVIELPRPPLQSVEFVKVIDLDGVETTLDVATYEVVTDKLVGFVRSIDGWPTGASMTIKFKTGWPVTGESPDFIATTPEDIQTWILIRVAGLYEAPEAFVIGRDVSELPGDFVDGLLDAHIIPVVV
ncbi:MAG: hypothetical protein JEY79_14000 [Pseudodesulfovibrio sp.]|nr:hypothetical protein [Pseudodesulfovibrio sp.]